MKTLSFLMGLLAFGSFAIRASAATSPVVPTTTTAATEDGSEVLPPNPYPLEHYSKLLSKSPFDFDVPPAGPPPAVDPMEGWALVGLSKTSEYQSVSILNMKGADRIRITKFNNPAIKKSNSVTVGGSVYQLESIQFEDGEPERLKNATAILTKDGNQVSVTYHAEAIQKNQAIAGQKPGMPPVPGQPAQIPLPTGATPQGQGNANLQAMLMQQQRNGAQSGGAQPQPQNLNLPQGQGQQAQPGMQVTNAQTAGSNQQQQALAAQMNTPQQFNNNAPTPVLANPGNNQPGAGTPNGGQTPRRRVVLPDASGPPPVPAQ